MAVAFVGNGTAVSSDGTTTVSCAPHNSTVAGNLQLLYVLYKMVNDTDATDFPIPDIEGWTLLWAEAGGVANTGDNTGFVANIVYWRSQQDPITTTVPVPDFACSSILAQQSAYSYSTTHVYLIAASAADSAHGANYSAQGESNNVDTAQTQTQGFGPASGEFVLAVTGLTSTAGSISADELQAAASGTTYTGESVRNDESTTSGDNVRLRVVSASRTGSPGTGDDPGYVHTNASSNSGSTIFIHIGELSGIQKLWHSNVRQMVTGTTGFSLRYRPQTTANVMAILTVMSGNLGLEVPGTFTVPSGWSHLGTKSETGGEVTGFTARATKVGAYYRFGFPSEQFTDTSKATFGQNSVSIASADGSIGMLEVWGTDGVWGFPTIQSDSAVSSTTQVLDSGVAMGLTTDDQLICYTVTASFSGTASISISGMSHSTDTNTSGTNYWGHVIGVGSCNLASDTDYLYSLTGTETGVTTKNAKGLFSTPSCALFIKISVFQGSLTLTATAPLASFSTYESRYSVVGSGIDTSLYDVYNLLRISTSDNYDPEFLRSDEPVTSTGFVVNDYEFHFAPKGSLDEESHFYRLELFKSGAKLGSIVSNTVQPHNDRETDPEYSGASSPSTWIKRLDGSTGAAYPVTIGDFSQWSKQANILSENHVLGSPYPFVVTDVMGGKRGSFSIIVHDEPSWAGGSSTVGTIEAVEALLDSGEILFFQTTWPMLSGIHDFYFKVRSYTVRRLNRVVALHDPTGSQLPVFEITVEYVEQERPADQGNIAPITWATILANYSTWSGMSAANTSWLDVLQDG